jgi:hypothetical protein
MPNGITPEINIFLQNLQFFKALLIFFFEEGLENELETLTLLSILFSSFSFVSSAPFFSSISFLSFLSCLSSVSSVSSFSSLLFPSNRGPFISSIFSSSVLSTLGSYL